MTYINLPLVMYRFIKRWLRPPYFLVLKEPMTGGKSERECSLLAGTGHSGGVASFHLHGENISMRIFPALLVLLIAAGDMVSP